MTNNSGLNTCRFLTENFDQKMTMIGGKSMNTWTTPWYVVITCRDRIWKFSKLEGRDAITVVNPETIIRAIKQLETKGEQLTKESAFFVVAEIVNDNQWDYCMRNW